MKKENVFSKHLATKSEPKMVLTSSSQELRDLCDGKTLAEIGDENDVDPDSGVGFAKRTLDNGNVIHNLVVTFGNGRQVVFPLSRALSAQLEEDSEAISGMDMLNWEARKVTVPILDKATGDPTGETRESLNIGLPSGSFTFDEDIRVVSFDDAVANEPAIAGNVRKATGAKR